MVVKPVPEGVTIPDQGAVPQVPPGSASGGTPELRGWGSAASPR
jgi:hypothetical protein